VSLEVVAGDGTKLKANAAMAGNLTREQLEAQISELEAWIGAGLRQWARDMLDGEGTPARDGAGAPSRDGDGDGPGDGSGSGTGKWRQKPARAAQMLERRLAARARLDGLQGNGQGKAGARIAELAARIERKEAAVRKWESAAAGRLEARARKAAAGQRASGTRAIASLDEDRDVRRARQALADARADHAAALAGTGGDGWRPDGRRRPGRPAGTRPGEAAPGKAARAGTAEAKASPADPASRIMPLKKGGYDQLYNVQALATARTQVILAVLRHDNPTDTGALHPLLAQARAVLDAAGIRGTIGKAVFDAGYASDANFTAATEAELHVALARESVQAGRSDGHQPQSALPSWQDMAARLATPEGKAVYKKRAPTIEPVFAQLTARLGRTLNYRGTLVDAELALWAASHNVLKAITARAGRDARQARTPAPAAA
jgi:hypothetical protein